MMQNKNKDAGKTISQVGQRDANTKQSVENVQHTSETGQPQPIGGSESDVGKVVEKQQVSIQSPKREQLDKEIEEMAKKIKLANERKMEQLRTFAIFNSPLSAAKHPSTEAKTIDWTSVQGQFGWAELANTTIPYLTRSCEKYVSLRMAENKIFIKYRNAFTDEVRSCFRVKIIHATAPEAQLLNEINFRHCDNFYGRLEFGVSDALITLDDLKEMYDFLNYCYLRLLERIAVFQNRCGFIKIANQNCVPYVWHDGKQYVPLFYFEGECKYLEERAVSLSGWTLAYLKLSCKIQGIRKNLYDGESVSVVEMELVKKFFPPDTLFEASWPTECRIESLVQRPVPKLVFSQVLDKMKETFSNSDKTDRQPQNAPKKIAMEKNGSVPLKKQAVATEATTNVIQSATGTNCLRLIQPYQKKQIPATLGTNTMTNGVQSTGVATGQSSLRLLQPYPCKSTTSSTSNSQVYTMVNNVQRQQAPVLKNRPLAPNSVVNCPPSMVGYQKSFDSCVMNNISQKSRCGMFQTGSKILQIAEVTGFNAYFLVKIQVEKKQFQHCINMEPFITNILLVTLEEISAFFQLPLNLVVNAVNVMNLDIFLPNKMQRKELEKCKIYSTKGLVRLQDFMDNLPQLKYILSKTKNFG